MLYTNRWAIAALAALFAGGSLAAQTEQRDRSVVIGVYGGGYDRILNLHDAGRAHGAAYFTPGHSFGTTVGVQLNHYVALHGDLTLTRNQAEGDASFAGSTFDRFFYGAHVELGYPLAGGVTPYLFLGGGAVTIEELGSGATIGSFTKPAGMFGAGLFYSFFGTRFEVFAEVKDLVYRWDRGGFAPLVGYIMTTGGQTYNVAFDTGRFDRTQWDIAYTLGVSYRLKTTTRSSTPAATPSNE
jgi:hypothetical protein